MTATRIRPLLVALLSTGALLGSASSLPRAARAQEAPSGVERLEQLLTRVRESQASVKTLRAAFVEHKESSLLLEPVEARGEFYFRAPGRVRWEYQSPEPMILVIRDGELTTWYQDLDQARRMSVGRQSQQMLRYLGMGSSVDELLGYFDVALRLPGETGEYYRLVLTPRYPRIAKRVAEVTVWIDAERYLPDRFRYVEPDGDSTEFWFQDLRINEPLAAGLFHLELPPGVQVEDAARLDDPTSR
ncbi:MAG: LolA family protein [Thermoanaerobaculia bacterium]